MGITFITSSINVYVRDAEYIIAFIINMLFYATPILYATDLFPTNVAKLLNLNPMTTIINCYRDILFYQSMPHIKSLLIVLACSIVLFYLGLKVFKKLEKGFAEEV
jgi:ABC-type polysaccharide/polyol phosphate export permease